MYSLLPIPNNSSNQITPPRHPQQLDKQNYPIYTTMIPL